MSSDCTRFTDTRRSVFIELRARGANELVAWNVDLRPTESPSRRSRASRPSWGFTTAPSRGVSIFPSVSPGEPCELYMHEGRWHVKPCKLHNFASPWRASQAAPPQEATEHFVESPTFHVWTTHALRQTFTSDVYALAQASQNPMHRVSALQAMEALFFSLVHAGNISRESAERLYDKYDKVAARIWRGATPGEQSNSFQIAFRMLARACGLSAPSAAPAAEPR